jgi:hypothetical protein
MTDHELYNQAFHSFVQNHKYLFTNSEPYMDFSKYLEHFQHSNPKSFFYLIPPAIYEPQIIENFKDNLVYTSFGSSGSGKQLFSVFQLDENTHLSASYLFIKAAEKFLVGFDIYCRDGSFFVDFLDKYKSLEYKESKEKQTFGFAGLALPKT